MDNVEAGAARLHRPRPHAGDAGPARSCGASSCPSACRGSGTRCGSASAGPGPGSSLAELVAATSGLGYRITTAQRFFQTDTIFGYLLLLGLLGLATDQAMKSARPPVLRLRGGAAMTQPRLELVSLRQGVSHRTPHGLALDGARPRRSARTSSSRWSAPRAAASPRCSRSSPGCRSPRRGGARRRAADRAARAATAASSSRATRCCPG